MNIKTLITTLVLGSTSIAAAEVRDHRTHAPTATASITATATIQPVRVSQPAPLPQTVLIDTGAGLRRHVIHTKPVVRPLPPVLTWVTLANDAHLNGRAFIKLAPTSRQFTKLQLRAEQGKTSIDKVMIVFGNGTSQMVNVDAKLTKRQPSLSIDLAGNTRHIERIVLVGKSNGRNASVDVLAI